MERKRHHRGRRKRKSNLLSNLILIIAVAVLLFSGYQLYKILSEYSTGEGEYQNLQDMVIRIEQKENGDGENTEELFKVDFEALRAINPDVVGWIRFDEPAEINYPVVQGKDNEKYLTKTFEANSNKLGTLFVDYRNTADFSGQNTFIYGHNMKNGSMFARLLKYKDNNYYKEHPYFYIYTPDGKVHTYQIFSAGVVKDTSDSYQMFYEDEQAFQNYIDYIKQMSAYATGVEVTTDSQIVSLSTCTNVRDDERYLVHGVKISEAMVE